MKNLLFSKDDILSALLDISSHSFVRTELVKSLLDAKINRLESDKSFEMRKFENEFDSIRIIEKNWDRLSIKEQKKCNNKVKKIATLSKQINSYVSYYNELNKSSFGNEPLDKLESNIKKVFKWEKPISFNEIFKRG